MLNIFKSQKKIIQEIHDSFDNAQEELLQQALVIINSIDTSSTSKSDRLKKLGFINTNLVLENEIKTKKLLESKEEAELVNYYKSEYPFLKFLKEEQLEAICKKYNLVFAPVSRYKEDVPEKNITEIENAKSLNHVDAPIEKCLVRVESFWDNAPNEIKTLLTKGIIVSSFDAYGIRSESLLLYKLKKDKLYNGNYNSYITSAHGKIIVEQQELGGLFIAAPKSHFNLEGLSKKKSGFFESTKLFEIKDPIVFRYVRGGIQVLSKWGLEANDELLQNEILN